MSPLPPVTRRQAGFSAAALAAFTVSGCGLFDDRTAGAGATTGSAARNPEAPSAGAVGRGTVKIALVLPLSGAGGGAGAAAASLRNAADLAMAEFRAPNLRMLVKDDRGTPEGAREAARAALDEGAELIVGPLFAPAVEAVAALARPAGVPVIAFSTDAAVARRGVYLLSFMPQSEVERIVDHAGEAGRRSLAALVPDTAYGRVVEGQFRDAAARRGLRVVAVERYPAGRPEDAVSHLAPLFAVSSPQIDTLLIAEGGDGLPAIGDALAASGFNPKRVKAIGTGLWNDPRALGVASLQGGWFAAPEAAGYNAFAERYRVRFGAAPVRVATLGYDAVSLAAALARAPGRTRFTDAAIESPAGFAGADGVFRFRPDGTNERALAVLEVRGGASAIVSPAPRALGPTGA